LGHRGDDVRSDPAGIEGGGAIIGDRAQRRRQRLVDQHGADVLRPAVRGVEIAARRLEAFEICIMADQSVQTQRDRKAVLGKINCRLKQPRPWQLAMCLVGELEGAQHAGNADRSATDGSIEETARLAVRLEEAVRLGCRWRCLPPIVSDDFLSRLVQ